MMLPVYIYKYISTHIYIYIEICMSYDDYVIRSVFKTSNRKTSDRANFLTSSRKSNI